MLSILASALWTLLSADNFAIPLAAYHLITSGSASTGQIPYVLVTVDEGGCFAQVMSLAELEEQSNEISVLWWSAFLGGRYAELVHLEDAYRDVLHALYEQLMQERQLDSIDTQDDVTLVDRLGRDVFAKLLDRITTEED